MPLLMVAPCHFRGSKWCSPSLPWSHHYWKHPSIALEPQFLPHQQLSSSRHLKRIRGAYHLATQINVERSNIMLTCLHLGIVTEHELSNISTRTFQANDVLVSAVHVSDDMENTITIWRYCSEFLFLHLKLWQPDARFATCLVSL